MDLLANKKLYFKVKT